MARRLTVDVDGDGLPERYGHDFWSPALQNTPMLFGGDWFDDVGYKTGFPERSRAADPETVEALEFLADAVHTYKVMPTSADVSRLGGSLFANGKAAMFYGNNHNFRGLIDAGLRFGVTAVPRPSADAPPRTIAFPDAYAMFAGQANAGAAFDFLEYLVSYEGAKLTFPALLSPRPRRSQADIWIDFARETLGLGERDIAAFLGSLDYVRMSPSFSIVDWGRYNQLINPSAQRILQGIAPAQTELEDLDRRLNSLIKEALGH